MDIRLVLHSLYAGIVQQYSKCTIIQKPKSLFDNNDWSTEINNDDGEAKAHGKNNDVIHILY